jgi:GT2 family glycosyltransferase
MPTARVELKKQKTFSAEEPTESDRQDLRRLLDQQRQQLAALQERVELLSNRDKEVREMCSAAMAERDELRSLLGAAKRERDDLYKRSDEVYAHLYTLQTKIKLIEQNGSRNEVSPLAEASEAVSYRELVGRIRDAVRASLPHDATVIVAGKGDEELLKLYGRKAWHYPQTETGAYAGYHPSTSMAAIAHLEILRAKGADYFLLPSTMLWWLDHYVKFRNYLETYYTLVYKKDHICVIYGLQGTARGGTQSWQARFLDAVGSCQSYSGETPSILDWNTGLTLATRFPDLTAFSPSGAEQALPYMDESVDIVVAGKTDEGTLTEAQRVAKLAVMSVPLQPDVLSAGPELEIEWKVDIAARASTAKTSIIVPWCNDTDEAEACYSIMRNSLPKRFDGEIIVVDSTSGGSQRLARLGRQDPYLRVARNRKAKDFLKACNAGANIATGEFLVFVNSEVLPLAGWLSPLLQIFRDRPEAGAVGGKLVSPEGRLVEAGGILFSNGAVGGFGARDSQTDLPLYSYVREVDYCSIALLATRRVVFEQVRGFDVEWLSLEHAAADYGVKIREKGYRVLYQPDTAAACIRPVCGSDATNDCQNIEKAGRAKLVDRWAAVLKKQPAYVPLTGSSGWQSVTAYL